MKAVMITLLSLLAFTSAFAGDDASVWQRLIGKQTAIEEMIRKDSDTSFEIYILPEGDENGDTFNVDARESYSYRQIISIKIRGVTKENIDQKSAEIAAIVVHEVKERKAHAERVLKALRMTRNDNDLDINVTGNEDIGMVGVKQAAGLDSDVKVAWVQMRGMRKKKMPFMSATGEWIRTSFSMALTEKAPKNYANPEGANQAGVLKVNSSIWTLQGATTDKAGFPVIGLIRVGTIKLGMRFDNRDGQSQSDVNTRGDLEIAGVSSIQVVPITKNINPFFEETVTMGMRMLDDNKLTARFVGGISGRLGVLFGTRFFTYGKVMVESDGKKNSSITSGGAMGYRFSKDSALSLGIDYTVPDDGYAVSEEGKGGYDSFNLTPTGYSGNMSFQINF